MQLLFIGMSIRILIAFRNPRTLENRNPSHVVQMVKTLILNQEWMCQPNTEGRVYQASGERITTLLELENPARALYKDEQRLWSSIQELRWRV